MPAQTGAFGPVDPPGAFEPICLQFSLSSPCRKPRRDGADKSPRGEARSQAVERDEMYDRVIYCDRCGRDVRTVPVEWFSEEPVLCPSCHEAAADQNPGGR